MALSDFPLYGSHHNMFGWPDMYGRVWSYAHIADMLDSELGTPAAQEVLEFDAADGRWKNTLRLHSSALGVDVSSPNTTWINSGLHSPLAVSERRKVEIWLKVYFIASTLECRLSLPTGATFVGSYQPYDGAIGSANGSIKNWDGTTAINSSTESWTTDLWIKIDGFIYGASSAGSVTVQLRASSGTLVGYRSNSWFESRRITT